MRLRAPAEELVCGIHAETKTRDGSYVMSGHHCHSAFELFYVESGDCRFLIDDRLRDLHAGDFIVIPPRTLHYTRYLFGICRRTVVLFDQSDLPEEVYRFLPQEKGFFALTRIFETPEEHREAINACLEALVAEEQTADERTPVLLRLHLSALFLLCSRHCRFVSEAPADIRTTDPQLLLAARFISEHFMEPISAADIAMAAGFSPNYLSRRFRQATGIGLHEYLVFVRLSHAAVELVSTTDSITQIAFRCGFSDSNYFKDAFKKKYGITPREYRKAQ